MTLYSSISKGQYTIPDYLPEDLHDLLGAILTVNPAERPSVAEIAAHPWCRSAPVAMAPPKPPTSSPPVLPPREDAPLDQDRGTTLVPFLNEMHSLEDLRSVHAVSGSHFESADSGKDQHMMFFFFFLFSLLCLFVCSVL